MSGPCLDRKWVWKGDKMMKSANGATLKYVAIGFACLVIALASVRALELHEMGPALVGATMISVLVASTAETRKADPKRS